MLSIRLGSNVPLAEQLCTGIKRKIASNELDVGTLLPTVRQLAADLGVNLNTIARAYQSLESQGLVVTAGRQGTRVVAKKIKPQPAKQIASEIKTRTAAALADASLVGFTRNEIEALVTAQIDTYFPHA